MTNSVTSLFIPELNQLQGKRKFWVATGVSLLALAAIAGSCCLAISLLTDLSLDKMITEIAGIDLAAAGTITSIAAYCMWRKEQHIKTSSNALLEQDILVEDTLKLIDLLSDEAEKQKDRNSLSETLPNLAEKYCQKHKIINPCNISTINWKFDFGFYLFQQLGSFDHFNSLRQDRQKWLSTLSRLTPMWSLKLEKRLRPI